MSGIFTVAGPDSVWIFTDGAGCNPDGSVAWIGSKILLMPEWPGAVATRGVGALPWMLRLAWASEVSSLDTALERVVADALAIGGHLVANGYHDPLNWEIVLAGWSDQRAAFEVWDVFGRNAPDWTEEQCCTAPPLTLRQLKGTTASWPVPDEAILKSLWPSTSGGLTPAEMALPVMEAVRRKTYPMPPSKENEYHSVGGFIQETGIGHDGISSSIIHRWPDVIGERINPFAAEPVR
ncbi:hypothetical protein PUR23_07105 [Methylorubrum populi]|uniref:hypothetical protein n=1 Tax=Methylorubrum populi TaxID=223967 RepID=UPI000AE73A58